MADLSLEEEKAYLVQKTGCTEDEAWNYLIAEEEFFEEKEAAGADMDNISEEELFSCIESKSGLERTKSEKLMQAELEFFEKNGI